MIGMVGVEFTNSSTDRGANHAKVFKGEHEAFQARWQGL